MFDESFKTYRQNLLAYERQFDDDEKAIRRMVEKRELDWNKLLRQYRWYPRQLYSRPGPFDDRNRAIGMWMATHATLREWLNDPTVLCSRPFVAEADDTISSDRICTELNRLRWCHPVHYNLVARAVFRPDGMYSGHEYIDNDPSFVCPLDEITQHGTVTTVMMPDIPVPIQFGLVQTVVDGLVYIWHRNGAVEEEAD